MKQKQQQNALRTKLAELQNSRRDKEKKEEEEKQTEEKATEEKSQKVEVVKLSPNSRLNAAIEYMHRRHAAAAAAEKKRATWGKHSSNATNAPSSNLTLNVKEGWNEPKNGWCEDVRTLERREKELQKMKCKPTYKRYLSTLPKFARKKGVHPRTPNKWINHSRRSWDKQVRLWKSAIYEWAGEAKAPLVVETPLATETPTSNGNDSRCKKETRKKNVRR